ncbi:hypothetical protein P3X46_033625 [Hevea brasiliensis]|uniref:Cytochrome b561 domain-containing protein n=1 Tax=Hevea brasiliensis TaxID=3981 RepID=A0ABQ9KBV6_HEVBR|nr:hypothetical protein P3X46_033625 [Hevea brasiliensis]
MDDEAASANTKVRKMNHRRAATVHTITLQITGSLVTMVMLLWAIRSGFKLAINSSRYTGCTDWAFHIGVLTMLLGFLFLILGIPISKFHGRQTISEVIVGIFATLIIMIMLWWTIYTGFRLATEHRRHSKYHLFTSSISVVTITSGLVYG